MSENERSERVKKYQAKSIEADDLVASGKKEKAISLLKECLGMTKKAEDEDYGLFFEAEIINYTSPDYPEQIKMLNKAVEWQQTNSLPDDPFFYKTIGVYYSLHNQEEEAIEFFDKALAIKSNDYISLRQKGVALSKLSRDEEAIILFDKALSIKPDDFFSLIDKGIALSKLGRDKEAIILYDNALKINPNNGLTIMCWALSAYYLNDLTICLSKLKEAAKLRPFVHDGQLMNLAIRLKISPDDKEWSKIFSNNAKPETLESISYFVGFIRKELKEKGQEFLEEIRKAKKTEADFLKPESLLDPEKSIMLILRKWNSYTPAIPTSEDERSRGGGYFIYHKGKGTVIDPGYNFLENFHEAGCRICDIDNIVITHAHNDHTIDFESICTLLHRFNTGPQKKKVRIYMNNGSFKKFSGILNLQDHSYIETICTLNQGNIYELHEGMTLKVLPAFHDEIISRDQSVGLLFSVPVNGRDSKILFTSDSGLYPLKLDDKEITPNHDSQKELWQCYLEKDKCDDIDLMIVHIGSINEKEITGEIKTEESISQVIKKCIYPNHLGVIGTIRMITKIAPRLAVISEFGEEMKSIRCELVNQIQTITDNILKIEPANNQVKPKVVPGDLAFIYEIENKKMFCCIGNEWFDKQKTVYDSSADDKDIFFFSEDSDAGIRNKRASFTAKIDNFKENRKDRQGMYFKKK